MKFNEFSLGDYAVFHRTFGVNDYPAFRDLSGDANPFHHDRDYAARQDDGGVPIVPLHMTLAPLSQVAGMIFPGEPSLYLGHEVAAIEPVRFGETITYSAKITAISEVQRILTLRVLALRNNVVVLDALMKVQARYDEWEKPRSELIVSGADRLAIVTGAAGEIGSAVARNLHTSGWKLALVARRETDELDALSRSLSVDGTPATIITGDLSTRDGRASVATAISNLNNIGALVHAASPAPDAEIEPQVAINFSALQTLSEAAAPNMLARQDGAIVLVGSTSVLRFIPGWEAYSGAKAMALNYLDLLDRRLSHYGVSGQAVMLGYVATEFSRRFRNAGTAALLPAEAGEIIASQIGAPKGGNVTIAEAGRLEQGRFGYSKKESTSHFHVERAPVGDIPADGLGARSPAEPHLALQLETIVRNVLRLAPNEPLGGGGLGITPGWDSLRHIDIVLALEATLGIYFLSFEIERSHQFEDLVTICQSKLASL